MRSGFAKSRIATSGTDSSATAQKPIRTMRRTFARSLVSAPIACAIIGATAAAGPCPINQQNRNTVLPSTDAASAVLSNRPSITVSVRPIAICATCVNASGTASLNNSLNSMRHVLAPPHVSVRTRSDESVMLCRCSAPAKSPQAQGRAQSDERDECFPKPRGSGVEIRTRFQSGLVRVRLASRPAATASAAKRCGWCAGETVLSVVHMVPSPRLIQNSRGGQIHRPS
jgi:hypothetical protein